MYSLYYEIISSALQAVTLKNETTQPEAGLPLR